MSSFQDRYNEIFEGRTDYALGHAWFMAHDEATLEMAIAWYRRWRKELPSSIAALERQLAFEGKELKIVDRE